MLEKKTAKTFKTVLNNTVHYFLFIWSAPFLLQTTYDALLLFTLKDLLMILNVFIITAARLHLLRPLKSQSPNPQPMIRSRGPTLSTEDNVTTRVST